MTREPILLDGGELARMPADKAGVSSYKGIPYAAPPVGSLRWRAPQPILPWKGVRRTDTVGPNSLQGVVFSDIDPVAAGVSEDCLYLNVWTPSDPGSTKRLPVLFWIHGGGFVVGSGAEPRYDGARLASRGIVVVTVNHRLNALGFLAHPELSAETDHGSGNYGMLDLVEALKWVSRNITQFGGDPDQVTIAGESAGSMAVSGLMASPLAKGLFSRAIGESGSLLAAPTEPVMTLAQAEAHGSAFAEKLGVTTLAQMRALPAKAILAAAPGLGFRPTIDGRFLPRHPAEIFAAGAQNDVPLLAGWNKDEGFNFNILNWGDGKRSFSDWVESVFGMRSGEGLTHYPGGTKTLVKNSARDLGGDLVINHGAWVWLEAQRKTGKSDIFRYRFDRAPKTPRGWLGKDDTGDAGAFHSCEILYVFDNLDAFPWLIEADDQKVATLTSTYWLNFVKNGDPNGGALPNWPSYREIERPLLRIDVESSVLLNQDHKRHEFLAKVMAEKAAG